MELFEFLGSRCLFGKHYAASTLQKQSCCCCCPFLWLSRTGVVVGYSWSLLQNQRLHAIHAPSYAHAGGYTAAVHPTLRWQDQAALLRIPQNTGGMWAYMKFICLCFRNAAGRVPRFTSESRSHIHAHHCHWAREACRVCASSFLYCW